MIRFGGQAILLDIEGTTSSISFVVDVLFPFVRRELPAFLEAHWDDPDVARARARMAASDRPGLLVEMLALMDRDAKTTGLKELQGLVWREGYALGELESHVYDDVPPALAAWTQAGLRVCIYSSGSAEAQRLLFAHTVRGDLSPYLGGYYDTTVGAKRSPDSYARIAVAEALAPGEWLFLSDVPEELDAARTAGMQTGLVVRPGNAPLAGAPGHPVIRDFAEIELA